MHDRDDYLDSGMVGCIVNQARRHSKRVAGCDVEDLIQEGYVCYYNCRRLYVGAKPKLRPDGTPRRFLPKTNPDRTAKRHFMRLVQRAISNRVNTLATKQPRWLETLATDMIDPEQTMDQAFENLLPPEGEVASVTELLLAAPKEIKQLLDFLISDAVKLTGYRRLGKGRRSRRETTNQYFCRVMRIPERDLVGEVERYFQVA